MTIKIGFDILNTEATDVSSRSKELL